MDGRPVTIRLLDPPLHEFLPREDNEFDQVAEAAGITVEALRQRMAELHEFNPMLGHRGCRLGISYPEIYEMQSRAIFEAIGEVADKTGKDPTVEIMVPLVSGEREFEIVKSVIDQAAERAFAVIGRRFAYLVGAMIELPSAALAAGEIGRTAQFMSFGTNDLTQLTLGLSRDDSGRFLEDYVKSGIFERDPFVTLQPAVKELMAFATERSRAANYLLKIGVCGEQGGDPSSIEFCEAIELDYVSASPFRVPTARLAAAQATIAQQQRAYREDRASHEVSTARSSAGS